MTSNIDKCLQISLIILIIAMLIILITKQYKEYYNYGKMDHATLGRLKSKVETMCSTEAFDNDKDNKDKLEGYCKKIKRAKLYQDETGSYTLSKKDVYMCLTDKEGELYNDNTLMNVLLHEYAHVVNPTIGHGEDFQEKFEFLKYAAERANVYNPSLPMPLDTYCKKD
jgi:hypothetical protein